MSMKIIAALSLLILTACGDTESDDSADDTTAICETLCTATPGGVGINDEYYRNSLDDILDPNGDLSTIGLPDSDIAFGSCNTASIEQCRSECETQIDGSESLCRACLLEDASFVQPTTSTDVECSEDCWECSTATCTFESAAGDCTSGSNNADTIVDEINACLEALPVSCDLELRAIADCAEPCGFASES